MTDVRRALNEMTEGASRLAARRTEVVAGVLSGSGAMAIGYVVTVFLPELSFFLLGPLLGLCGISAGILIGRRLGLGMREDEMERHRRLIEQNREGVRLIRQEPGTLPAGTPKAVRDTLYRRYMELNAVD